MAYVPTNWVDAETPVDAANMNKIEAELAALDVRPGMDLSYDGDWVPGTYEEGDTVVKDGIVWMCVGGPTNVAPDHTLWGTLGPVAGGGLPADTVVPAATRIISNKLLALDAQPSWRVLGSGKQEFGPGGAGALDTNLYRSGAGVLKTDGIFQAAAAIQSLTDVYAYAALPAQICLTPGPGGVPAIFFGPAFDTSLYRSAAGVLNTDGHFITGGSLQLRNVEGWGAIQAQAAGRVGLSLGPVGSFDTYLYRHAAGILRADGSFALSPGGTLILNNGNATQQIEMAYNGSFRQYRHTISTQHHGGESQGNVIDFRIWSMADLIDALPSLSVLRLQGDGKAYFGQVCIDPSLPGMSGPGNLDHRAAGDAYISSSVTGGRIVLRNLADGGEVSVLSNGRLVVPIAGIGFSDGTIQTTAGSGREVAYAARTSDFNFTVGTNIPWMTAPTFTADGVSAYWLEYYCPNFYSPGDGQSLSVVFMEGAAVLGSTKYSGSNVLNEQMPTEGRIRIVPAAGTHTYTVAISSTNANGGMYCQGYSPCYVRVTKA